MIRRTALLGAVLVAAIAPSAHAADPFNVQAFAVSTPPSAGQMTVTVQCAAADAVNTIVDMKCFAGPARADGNCPTVCANVDAGANTAVGPAFAWELCVWARSYGPAPNTFYRCAGMDPLTRTAVISHGLVNT